LLEVLLHDVPIGNLWWGFNRRGHEFRAGILIDSQCYCSDSIAGAQPMSAPSRRPEIRRRRTRQHKITTLRQRLASAQTDGDRARITAKLHKLAIASPGQPLLK
jgi:uncharacterized protein DUF6800